MAGETGAGGKKGRRQIEFAFKCARGNLRDVFDSKYFKYL